VFWGKKHDLKRELRRKIAENGGRIGKNEKKIVIREQVNF
jgi:hypothetical protein